MNHASLFTGIGGFDLASEWMGWNNIFQVEIDEWCQRLLKQNFPHAERYGDIKQIKGWKYSGTIDVLSGGFPCQPYSTAGKRKGKSDDRHLWPEMLRVIREVSPRWVVGENVRGLTNWNGGLVFDEVQADLEAAGYEVIPFLLPAAGVNAPHRRDRVWFIAYSCGDGYQSGKLNESGYQESKSKGERLQRERLRTNSWRISESLSSPHSSNEGLQSCTQIRKRGIRKENGTPLWCSIAGALAAPKQWHEFPTQPPVCGRNDGIPYRVDRIKGLGNAVVPQVVYQIFKAIELYETLNHTK